MGKKDRLNKEIDLLSKIMFALFAIFIYVALYHYDVNQLMIVAPVTSIGGTLVVLRILKDLKELENEV